MSAMIPVPLEDDGPLTLPDLLVAIEHVAEDLDMITEDLAHARHAQVDSFRVAEVHAIESDALLAWAYARQAVTALRSFLATVPSG